MITTPRAQSSLTAQDVRRVCGNLPEWKIEGILDSGATLEDLEQAASWAAGDNESTPMRHLAPHAAASVVFDILMAGQEDEEGDA